MEYASRGDLLDYINSRSKSGIGIGEELAKNLFRQLAEGVAHCHRRNVVHRCVEDLHRALFMQLDFESSLQLVI